MNTKKLKTMLAGLSAFALLSVLTAGSAFAADRTTRTTTVQAGRGGVTVTKTTTSSSRSHRTTVVKNTHDSHRGHGHAHGRRGKHKNWKKGHRKHDCHHVTTTTYHRTSQPVLVKRTVRKPHHTTVTYVR